MVLQRKRCGRVGRCRNYGSPVWKQTGLSSLSLRQLQFQGQFQVIGVVVGLGKVLVLGSVVAPALVLVVGTGAEAETETAPVITAVTCTTPEPTLHRKSEQAARPVVSGAEPLAGEAGVLLK